MVSRSDTASWTTGSIPARSSVSCDAGLPQRGVADVPAADRRGTGAAHPRPDQRPIAAPDAGRLRDRCDADYVLFADGLTTSLPRPDGVWRRKPGDEEGWQVVIDDTVAASAGLLFHYNPPFADVYMDVHESFRRRVRQLRGAGDQARRLRARPNPSRSLQCRQPRVPPDARARRDAGLWPHPGRRSQSPVVTFVRSVERR